MVVSIVTREKGKLELIFEEGFEKGWMKGFDQAMELDELDEISEYCFTDE